MNAMKTQIFTSRDLLARVGHVFSGFFLFYILALVLRHVSKKFYPICHVKMSMSNQCHIFS